MSSGIEQRSTFEKVSKWAKLIGVAFIGFGALFGSANAVGLGALKVVGGKMGEDYFKKKKK